MNRRYSVLLLGLALMSCAAGTTLGEGLDGHLEFLQPLLGMEWVGGYVGEPAPDVELRLVFTPVLDGATVSYSRDADALDFHALTHFFWDSESKEVRFRSMNSRGTFEEGSVEVDGRRFILHGTTYFPGGTREFRTEFELGEDGALTDMFFRVEDGRWIRGHVQRFTATGEGQ